MPQQLSNKVLLNELGCAQKILSRIEFKLKNTCLHKASTDLYAGDKKFFRCQDCDEVFAYPERLQNKENK